MTAEIIMKELEAHGSEQTRKIYKNHGYEGNVFGVKVADMKKIAKQHKIKKDYQLAKDLFNTRNADAQYLAGLIADETQMTEDDLRDWADKADWTWTCEYTVPWVAAETPHGWELGLEWIEEDNEVLECAGWSTLASIASVTPNEELDIDKYKELVDRAANTIHDQKNRVRYVMNGFVIAVGSYIPSLTDHAKKAAEKIGKVSVNVGNTSCKVPFAPEYIQKVVDKDRVGKKRKGTRC